MEIIELNTEEKKWVHARESVRLMLGDHVSMEEAYMRLAAKEFDNTLIEQELKLLAEMLFGFEL